uniref:Immunoglobulin-like domain containing receptor 1b n=1 Tax=Neogobius melanostomus TaxID=47308 RepID=A0A8C6UAJ0_9GOBI
MCVGVCRCVYVLSIQVTVPETERSTTLFASVILRCDYSTSANPQDVLVSWKYKSFCKDPVLDYYSTAYQTALQLGQDPSNDCPDRQRTVRTVIQKRGLNEPILGADYRERKITIQNKAELVITEVMWWDNGVYYCTIDAPGDTTGDSDREVKLIVYHWLTVLFIIIGVLLLIMLFCICCCQCCPQKCCCYIRCPCCPQTCCCPEKAVMQHRMIREAQKAMVPWMQGQPIYAPISSNASAQGVPILYSGETPFWVVLRLPKERELCHGTHATFTNGPPGSSSPMANGSLQGSLHGNGHMLDYLEHQVRGLDVPTLPQNMAPYQSQAPPAPPPVPYTPGPPSMLSALDEMGVRGMERRVITLPPIIQRNPSYNSRRVAGGAEGARAGPRLSSQSSGSTNRSGVRGHRDTSPPRRGILRDYNEDSDWDNRRSHRRNERGGSSGRRSDRSRPRARSRDDLMEELQSRGRRRERSYSPPQKHKASWSSDEDDSRRRKGGKYKDWPEKPPSYFSIEMQPGSSRGDYNHLSVSTQS